MTKVLLFFALIICPFSISKLHAQSQDVVIKQHYLLSSTTEGEDLTLFEQALSNYLDLDQYRFLNHRRTIKFSGTNVSIELFSADELLTQYGKQISPLTIMTGTFYKPVDFMITNNDEVLTVFPLYVKQDPIQY